ncbi:MAG: hypothetical protein HY319_18550 [Armatimonadetes bacterium]|nr:hypothetical protein [Armatimonadota bacterium]
MPGRGDIDAYTQEAERHFLSLGELARSLGLEGTAKILQEKAGWMAAARGRSQGSGEDIAADLYELEATGAIREVLLELKDVLDRAVASWPPEDLAEVIVSIHLASARLHRLRELEESSGRLAGRRKERWGTEPPPTEEPPPFRPGQKRRP